MLSPHPKAIFLPPSLLHGLSGPFMPTRLDPDLSIGVPWFSQFSLSYGLVKVFLVSSSKAVAVLPCLTRRELPSSVLESLIFFVPEILPMFL